jgi:Alpha/beta hydrolase domain
MVIAGVVALLGALVSGTSVATAGSTRTTRPARPAGPAAVLQPIADGDAAFMGEAAKPDLRADGYVQREYTASGTATTYETPGYTADGRWTFTPSSPAPYTTRVLVRAPAKQQAFSGNVVVEWLNVSAGVDADPEWTNTAEELTRSGDIWVGVSAQLIGVEGGPVIVKVDTPGSDAAGKGLKAIDPSRYGSLQHPGDGYAFDIYTQVARALRAGSGLAGEKPAHLLAAGESQSAFALVTYYDGVQPLTHEFDGFFVHSRGGVPLPIAAPGSYAGIEDAISGTPAVFRDDQAAPVMDVQTETDVAGFLNSYGVRQPDSQTFRLWEVAGTAHADARLVGSHASSFDCGAPINDGPLHVVAKAALHDLKGWVAYDAAPPRAPRLDVVATPHVAIVRNSDGIAEGGIRTPPVDVPVSVLSGEPGPEPSTICLLSGSDTPLPAARIAHLYPSRAAYLKQFDRSADAAIKAGFVLPADRAALLAFAQPDRVSG